MFNVLKEQSLFLVYSKYVRISIDIVLPMLETNISFYILM